MMKKKSMKCVLLDGILESKNIIKTLFIVCHFSSQEGLMAIILSALAIKIKVEKVSILLKIPIWEHFCHPFYVVKWDEKRKLEKNGHK